MSAPPNQLPVNSMTQDAEARNELEKCLIEAQEGRITSDDLLETLMASQVLMPLVALFSCPERAKAFTSDYPGFGGGLLTEFTWVLEKMGRDFGIALNPGSEIGFDMEPETVNELIDALNAGRTKH